VDASEQNNNSNITGKTVTMTAKEHYYEQEKSKDLII
jgi:hypothetical protein